MIAPAALQTWIDKQYINGPSTTPFTESKKGVTVQLFYSTIDNSWLIINNLVTLEKSLTCKGNYYIVLKRELNKFLWKL